MKRRDLFKKAGATVLWTTPVVSSINLPAHAVLSEAPRSPTFELIEIFSLHIGFRPNLIVRLSDDSPGISWREERDNQFFFLPQVAPVYQPASSGNTGAQRSVDLEFFGVPQLFTYIRLFATDQDGNTAMFEQVFGVA